MVPRKAILYKLEKDHEVKGPTSGWKRVPDVPVVFHGFGQDLLEFETGPGNFTCAIIEDSEGHLKTVDINLIQFVVPTQAGG